MTSTYQAPLDPTATTTSAAGIDQEDEAMQTAVDTAMPTINELLFYNSGISQCTGTAHHTGSSQETTTHWWLQ